MTTYKLSKNGSLERPRGVSKEQFISASYGEIFDYEPNDSRYDIYYFSGSTDYASEDYRKLKALKNTINYYSGFSDSLKFINYENTPVCMLALNSYYLGSGLQPGSVELNIYLSGSYLDRATDRRENGVLSSSLKGDVGIVLYREGFILLNNTSSLYGDIKWTNFLSTSNLQTNLRHEIKYNYNNNIETNTIFIAAEKNELNHSNNTTYIKSGSYTYNTSNNLFQENPKLEIKNTVQSPFVSGTANFEKETYITKIGMYDKDKKLIGVASLSNPVRKTENREFIFKLKLDI